MISKPPAGWDREDSGLVAARQVAGATSTVFAAGRAGIGRAGALYRGCVLGFVACICGWAALGAGVLGGDMATLIGAGALALLMGWLAARSIGKAFGREQPAAGRAASAVDAPRENIGNTEHNADVMPRGRETVLYYDRSKLMLRLAKLSVVFALVCCAAIADTRHGALVRLLLWGFAAFTGWGIATTLLRVCDADLTAMAWDNQRIRVRAPGSSCEVTWDAVRSVDVERRVYRLWGMFPVSRTHNLVLRLNQKRLRSAMRLPLDVIDMRPTALADLGARLAMRGAPAGSKIQGPGSKQGFSKLPQPAEALPSGASADWDRDAIMARSIGERADAIEADAASAMAPARAFGRRVV